MPGVVAGVGRSAVVGVVAISGIIAAGALFVGVRTGVGVVGVSGGVHRGIPGVFGGVVAAGTGQEEEEELRHGVNLHPQPAAVYSDILIRVRGPSASL